MALGGLVRRSRRALGPAWIAAAILLGTSVEAHAWTEAEVQSIAAELDVGADGSALVTLDLGLRVHRGWLTGLDLDGLDEDLALESGDAIDVLGEDGTRHRAKISARPNGRLELAFKKADAPRRGTYRATLVYRTSLAITPGKGPETRKVGWTLPAFVHGLSGVRVTMLVPAGSTPALEGELSHVETTVEPSDTRNRVTFTRAHLPRTVAWNVAVEVPVETLAVAAPLPPESTSTSSLARAVELPIRPRPTWLVLALLVVGIGLLKRTAFRRACGEARVRPRALLPFPIESLRVPVIVGAAAASAILESFSLDAAFALLALAATLTLERAPTLPSPPRPGAFRPADAADVALAQKLVRREKWSLLSFLDATRPQGATLLVAVAIAVLALDVKMGTWALGPSFGAIPTLAGLVLALAPMVAGARAELPSRPFRRLMDLLAVREQWGDSASFDPPFATTPLLYAAADGEWQDARIGVHPTHAPEGLCRMDLAVADRPEGGEMRKEVVLLLTVTVDSPADRALAGLSDLPVVDVRTGRRARAGTFTPALLAEVLRGLASGSTSQTASPPAAQGAETRPARSEVSRALVDASSALSIARSTAESASLP